MASLTSNNNLSCREKNIAELTKWLKERDSATIERRPCGSQVLEEEVVMALEKYIDSHFNRGMKKRIVPVNSKPSQLYLVRGSCLTQCN